MAAFVRPSLIRLPGGLPLAGGAATGLLAALATALVPAGRLADVAAVLNLADLAGTVPPAIRAAFALGAGGAAAAVTWAALYLLWGPGGVLGRAAEGAPAVRRADAHPDAPPRRPLTAAELAEAFGPAASPAAPGEQAVPADLDTPLASLDPAAIPAVPLEPVRALAPLAPGERLEVFALARPARAPAPAEPPSIEALLRRLEAGAERRAARAA